MQILCCVPRQGFCKNGCQEKSLRISVMQKLSNCDAAQKVPLSFPRIGDIFGSFHQHEILRIPMGRKAKLSLKNISHQCTFLEQFQIVFRYRSYQFSHCVRKNIQDNTTSLLQCLTENRYSYIQDLGPQREENFMLFFHTPQTHPDLFTVFIVCDNRVSSVVHQASG